MTYIYIYIYIYIWTERKILGVKTKILNDILFD